MVSFALSVMPEDGFARAALPLFSEGIVDMAEWSFDMGWGPGGTPRWLTALVDDYANADALIGHGVSFSLLGGASTPRHAAWLERLRRETGDRRYHHISEHIGFVGGGEFSFAAPLPMPLCEPVVEFGRQRMRLLADAAGCPVGLENLATSLGPADADDAGQLVDLLLTPVDGFAVLDLHNIWCQAINVERDPVELARTHPLQRAREVHVSGGSWDTALPHLRRDTHDDVVPDEVLALLTKIAPSCPNLEVVVLERLGTTLTDPAQDEAYRDDARRIAALVAALPAPSHDDPDAALAEVGASVRAPSVSRTRPDCSRDVPPLGCDDPPCSEGSASDSPDLIAEYQRLLLGILHDGTDELAMAAAIVEASVLCAGTEPAIDPALAALAGRLTRTWSLRGR